MNKSGKKVPVSIIMRLSLKEYSSHNSLCLSGDYMETIFPSDACFVGMDKLGNIVIFAKKSHLRKNATKLGYILET